MSPLSPFNAIPEFSFRSYRVAILQAGVTLTFLFATSFTDGQDLPSSLVSHEVKSIFERSAKAVVKIHATDQHGELSGTGFFVDPTGMIYTCYSVGGDATNFRVEMNGKKLPARQVMVDLR